MINEEKNNNKNSYDKNEYLDNNYNELNNKSMNNSPFEKILSVIFVMWFIGSIISLVVLSEINGYYTVIVLGQFFLVFGLVIPKGETKDWLITITFILVGLVCLIIPFLMLHPELVNSEVDWDYVIVILVLSAFVIAGLAMIFIPIRKYKRLKKVCSISITAKIVENLSRYSDGKKLYCPVYEFDFGGKKYNVSDNIYTNIGVKPVGTLVDMKINPNDPNEFLNKEPSSIILLVMGIIFLLASIPILIYVIINGIN